MPIDVPPTKANLLELKDQLAIAKSGYELLEEKREVLVSELLNIIDDAEAFRREVTERLAAAFSALEEAIYRLGEEQVQRAALACVTEAQITLRERSIMGSRFR